MQQGSPRGHGKSKETAKRKVSFSVFAYGTKLFQSTTGGMDREVAGGRGRDDRCTRETLRPAWYTDNIML